jgi:hypothetical protein
VALLLLEPRRFLRPVLLAATPAPAGLAAYYSPRPLRELPPEQVTVAAGPRSTAVLNSAVLTIVALLIVVEQTFNNLSVNATVSIGALPSHGAFPNVLRFSTQQQGTPWDTFTLLALWAYCGARVLMGEGEVVAKETADRVPMALTV